MALGHVLAALEESEHAVAAYRTAAKLLPGDHRPLLFMGKELVRPLVRMGILISTFRHISYLYGVRLTILTLLIDNISQIRTGNLSLAHHVLQNAIELQPNDIMALNELGVVYLKQQRLILCHY